MRFFESSTPACVTIGSLNLIGAARSEPRAIPLVSIVLSSLKRIDRFPAAFDLTLSDDQVVILSSQLYLFIHHN